VLGLNPVERVQVHGELDTPPERGEPVPLLVQRALELRGDVAVAEAEVQVSQRRVSLSEREGFPNVTLSAFFAREEFDQRLIGGGISIPLPLPSPVWPSRKGEQQEQRARTAQAESDVQAVRRRVAVEVRRAAADEALRAEALRAFDAEVVAQAPKNLRELGDALSLGRLSVRDALLAQRSLIELLLGYSDARLALALANVELDRTAALLVKGDSP
jgi:cobalt-zinc-cadmium efflux system outer membrane protein